MKDINNTTVCIDGSALVNNPQSGVGQYARNLLIEASKIAPGIKLTVMLFSSDGKLDPALPSSISVVYIPMHRKIYMLMWKYIFPMNISWLLKLNPHIVLYPDFATRPYLYSPGIKTATVIHDLAYIHYPETLVRRNLQFLKKAVPRSLAKSDVIICPSQSTVNDILHSLPRNDKLRFEIIHPGTSIQNHALASPLQKKPYLLFLGTIEPRKNISILIKSFLSLKVSERLGHKLVIAGKRGWGDVKLPSHNDIIYLGEVSEKDKHNLMHFCEAFIFPSLFEGFGMPVIEAMAYSKPVIASSTSSLGELVNEKRAYVINNPRSEVEIISAIKAYYNERQNQPEELASKIREAKKFAASFTWYDSANKLVHLFRTLDGGK